MRQFEFDFFKPSVSMIKDIKLFVKEKGAANGYACWSLLSVCGAVSDRENFFAGLGSSSLVCFLVLVMRWPTGDKHNTTAVVSDKTGACNVRNTNTGRNAVLRRNVV